MKNNHPPKDTDNFESVLFIAFLFTLVGAVIGLLGQGYNFLSFLFIDQGKFDDFINGVVQAKAYFSPELLDLEGFSQVAAPLTIVYYLFWQLFIGSYTDVYLAITFLYLIYVFSLHLLIKKRKAWILLSLSYPLWYLFGRGNPDILAGIVLIYAIWMLDKNKPVSYLLFGALASIKFPYAIFGAVAIFIDFTKVGWRKSFKSLFIFSISLITFFFVPFKLRPWPISTQVDVFFAIVRQYYSDYVIGDAGLLHNSSLFGFIKSFYYLFFGGKIKSIENAREISTSLANLYTYILVLIGLLLFFRLFNFKLINLKSRIIDIVAPELFLLATFVVIFAPQVSADYRLALLIPTLAYLININSEFLRLNSVKVLLFLLLIPKHFIYWRFSFHDPGVTLNTVLNGPLLLILSYKLCSFISSKSEKRYSEPKRVVSRHKSKKNK